MPFTLIGIGAAGQTPDCGLIISVACGNRGIAAGAVFISHACIACAKEEYMDVPAKTSPQWADIVTGKTTYSLKFLAAKILLGRLVPIISADPSPDNVRLAAEQLHALYDRNSSCPSVQLDLKNIFR